MQNLQRANLTHSLHMYFEVTQQLIEYKFALGTVIPQFLNALVIMLYVGAPEGTGGLVQLKIRI